MYTDDADQASYLSVLKPKLNYIEAIKYFEETEKELFDNNYTNTESDISEGTDMEVQ